MSKKILFYIIYAHMKINLYMSIFLHIFEKHFKKIQNENKKICIY